MDLLHLKTFLSVARTGGFAAAAQERNVAPSSVTRAISKLEESLGVRLFQRTTRRVSLTDAGEAFLARITPALEEIDAASHEARTGDKSPSGALRVTASTSYGQIVIAPLLEQFHCLYPDISLDLLLSDAIIDLVGERIDIAIRHGKLEDSSLIVRRLQPVEYWLVASPEYLARHPKIRRPEDISRHRCISFTYQHFTKLWRFSRKSDDIGVIVGPFLKISNAVALAECARRGMGLTLLADWTVGADVEAGHLVHILPSWSVRASANLDDNIVSLVTPSRSYVPAKATAFIEFLKDRIA